MALPPFPQSALNNSRRPQFFRGLPQNASPQAVQHNPMYGSPIPVQGQMGQQMRPPQMPQMGQQMPQMGQQMPQQQFRPMGQPQMMPPQQMPQQMQQGIPDLAARHAAMLQRPQSQSGQNFFARRGY